MEPVDTGSLGFPSLRSGGYCYVDKSMLIGDILDADEDVFLYTRPRRFGKTTNLTMLDAFFNIRYRGNGWFDGLEIFDHPEYDVYRNSFPIIHMDLGICKEPSFDSFINMFEEVVYDAFDEHRYLLDSDALDQETRSMFGKLDSNDCTVDDLKTSINVLSSTLEGYHGTAPMILIDEYDRPVQDGDDSIMDFIRSFLQITISENPHRSIVYMTGVTVEWGVLPDPDGMRNDNVLSTKSDGRFGFTGSEVRGLLSHYGLPDDFGKVWDWYGGYRFGNSEVCSPYDILNHISDRDGFKPYWINTAKDTVFERLLDRIDLDLFSDTLSLIGGGSVIMGLNNASGTLYSLMVTSGYLKAVPQGNGVYEVSIPNMEVMSALERTIQKARPVDDPVLTEFDRSVSDCDADRMVDLLQSISTDPDHSDSFYLVLMTMMHVLMSLYEMKTEYEAGNGRLDMTLIPKRDGIPPMIFELKKVHEGETLDGCAEAALAQIHDRRYYDGISGDVVLYGIAFKRKVPKVMIEKIAV